MALCSSGLTNAAVTAAAASRFLIILMGPRREIREQTQS